MNMRGRSTHPQEAIATIDGSSLCRPERHSSFNPAQCAFDRDLDSLAREGLTVRLHVGGDPVILFYFTRLAPFRIVLQSLVSEKELFPRSEDEFFIAIYTSQYLILVFVHCGPPTPCSHAGSVLTVLRDRSTSFLPVAVSYVRSLFGFSLNDLPTCILLARCDHIQFPDFVTYVSYVKMQPKWLPAIIALFAIVSSELLKKLPSAKTGREQARTDFLARF
jgi:hypothetical protein